MWSKGKTYTVVIITGRNSTNFVGFGSVDLLEKYKLVFLSIKYISYKNAFSELGRSNKRYYFLVLTRYATCS